MSKRLSSEEEQILGMSYSGMRQGYENWHVAVESSVLHRAVADYGRQGFYGYMRDHASHFSNGLSHARGLDRAVHSCWPPRILTIGRHSTTLSATGSTPQSQSRVARCSEQGVATVDRTHQVHRLLVSCLLRSQHQARSRLTA